MRGLTWWGEEAGNAVAGLLDATLEAVRKSEGAADVRLPDELERGRLLREHDEQLGHVRARKIAGEVGKVAAEARVVERKIGLDCRSRGSVT